MKNTLTFTRNQDTLTILSNLNNKLNDVTTDLSYDAFALTTIAEKHTDATVSTDAKRLLAKQIDINDELVYLNSCIVFLKHQIEKKESYSTLTTEEINGQIKQLIIDIQEFYSLRQTLQNVCFRFVNKHSQNEFRHLLLAA